VKKTLITSLSAVALLLGGCASPRTAEISDGKIKNITSAEATTLAKADIRQKKVADVQKNAKPLLRFEAHDGQPITINAKVFEVNAPQDIRELLSEQASEVSENVQVLDRVARMGERVVVPLAAVGFAADVAKRRSDNAKTVALDDNTTRRAEIAADAAMNADLVEAAQKDPLVIQVPLGSSVLSGGTEAAAATTPAATTP
jgi:cell division protein ZapA (FtsZ GTPase activity inhibitor)